MPSLHSDPYLSILRRSAAELLACVVQDLFPQVLLVGGGVNDAGFYYDFIFEQPIQRQMLELLEVEMRKWIKEEREVRSIEMMRENAQGFFLHHDQPLLAQRVEEQEDNIVSLFQIEKFHGLSESPHVQKLSEIGAFKLLEIQETETFLQEEVIAITRLIGTAFADSRQLKQFLKLIEKFKRRDHRQLGPQLNLFHFFDQASDLECFWHPKGEQLRQNIINWHKEVYGKKSGAYFVSTPLIIKESFALRDPKKTRFSFSFNNEAYILNHSRLETHIELFNSQSFTTNQLPVRFVEWSPLYQNYPDPLLWGLLRSRSYVSDSETIFCLEEQVHAELISSLQFIQQTIRIFDFEYRWYVVIPEQKKIRSEREKQAVKWLTGALEEIKIDYLVEESLTSDQDFHLEVRLIDSLGREWPTSFIRIWVTTKGSLFKEERIKLPSLVFITKSLFGSLDRFIALLIEQQEGELPLWLTPEQIRVIPVGPQNQAYAEKVRQACIQQGFRVESDVRLDKLSVKVHAAEKELVPYILIIGDKEEQKQMITVRSLSQRKEGQAMKLEDFFIMLRDNNSTLNRLQNE